MGTTHAGFYGKREADETQAKLDQVIAAINGSSAIDYTTQLNDILAELQSVEANGDTVEAELAGVNTNLTQLASDVQAGNVTSTGMLTALTAHTAELAAINANTDNVEALITALTTEINDEGDETQALLTSILDALSLIHI